MHAGKLTKLIMGWRTNLSEAERFVEKQLDTIHASLEFCFRDEDHISGVASLFARLPCDDLDLAGRGEIEQRGTKRCDAKCEIAGSNGGGNRWGRFEEYDVDVKIFVFEVAVLLCQEKRTRGAEAKRSDVDLFSSLPVRLREQALENQTTDQCLMEGREP